MEQRDLASRCEAEDENPCWDTFLLSQFFQHTWLGGELCWSASRNMPLLPLFLDLVALECLPLNAKHQMTKYHISVHGVRLCWHAIDVGMSLVLIEGVKQLEVEIGNGVGGKEG